MRTLSKRIISLLMVLAMLGSLVVIPAFAATDKTVGMKLTFKSVDTEYAESDITTATLPAGSKFVAKLCPDEAINLNVAQFMISVDENSVAMEGNDTEGYAFSDVSWKAGKYTYYLSYTQKYEELVSGQAKRVFLAAWTDLEGKARTCAANQALIYAYFTTTKEINVSDLPSIVTIEALNSKTQDVTAYGVNGRSYIDNSVVGEEINYTMNLTVCPGLSAKQTEGTTIYNTSTVAQVKAALTVSALDVSGNALPAAPEYTLYKDEACGTALSDAGLTAGTQTLYVKADGYPVTPVEVTVTQDTLVAISLAPKSSETGITKTYTSGDNFDKNSVVVTATYASGATKTVTDYTIAPADPLTVAKITAAGNTLTFSYTDGDVTKTADLTGVTVNKKLIAPPSAIADLVYDGREQTGVADPASDAGYALTGNKATDAGNYTATATLDNETETAWNDTAFTGSVPWTISTRPITIKAADQTIAYGGQISQEASEVSVTSTPGLASGDTITNVTLTASGTDVTTSGTITISSVVIKNAQDKVVTANYATSFAPGVLTITKAAATVTAAPEAITGLDYSSTDKALVTPGTASGGTMQYALGTNDTTAPTSDWGTSVPNFTDAGIYYVWYMVAGDANHSDTTPACVTVTVDKASPVITANPTAAPITYGQTLNDSALSGGTANVSGTFAWADTSTAPTVAQSGASFSVTFTPSDTTNYKPVTAQVPVTVNKADSSATAPTAATGLTYTGDDRALVTAGTATGGTMQYALGTDGTTAPTSGWSTGVPTGKNAGDYFVWYKVVGDANHNDIAAQALASAVTIAKADYNPALTAPTTANPLVLQAKTTVNKNYELFNNVIKTIPSDAGSVKFALTGTPTGGITPDITGSEENWTLNIQATNLAKDATASCQIKVTSTNYNDATLTVNFVAKDKKPVTVTAAVDPATVTYGDAINVTKGITGYTEPATGGTWTLTYSGRDGTTYAPTTVAPVNVGKYSVVAEYSDTVPDGDVVGHYGESPAANFEIVAKEVTVNWTAEDSYTYTGSTLTAPTASFTGAGEEGTIACTVAEDSNKTFKDADDYNFTASTTNTNYTLTGNTKAVTIDPAAATVKADNKYKTYGDSDPTLTAKVTGLVNNEPESVLTYILGRDEGDTVGEYTITPTGAAIQGNYTVSYVSGTFTINPANATVTADNQSKTYGDADPTLTATVTGLKGTDTASVLSYTVSRAAGEDVKAGGYAITPAGDATQGNYTVTYVPGTFTIAKATPTVSTAPTASAITYGQLLRKSELTGGAAVNGTVAVPGTFSWTNGDTTTPAVTDSDTTAYPVTFTPSDTANYNTAATTATVTVNPAEQATPTGLGVTAPTAEGGNGSITGTTAAMEYSTDKTFATGVTPCTADPTSVAPGTYYVRKAATADGNYKASEPVEVVVPDAGTAVGTVAKSGTDATANQIHPDLTSAVQGTQVVFNVDPPADGKIPTKITVSVNGVQKEVSVRAAANGTYVSEPVTMPAPDTSTTTAEIEFLSATNEAITVSLTPSALNLTTGAAGQTVRLTVTPTPAEQIYTDWTIDTTTVAEITASDDSSATVKGLAAGTGVTLTATVKIGTNTYPATCTVTVTAPTPPSPSGGGGAAPATNPVNITPASSGSTASHAKVTSNTAKAKAGDKVTLTVTADEGYQVDGVKVTDAKGNEVPVTKNADGTYTFTMPATAVKVEPVVSEAPPAGTNSVKIAPAASGTAASHGKVASSASYAKPGDTVTLTVTPDAGYQVDGVKVTDANGKDVPVTRNADGTYSFVMPDSAVSVEPVVSAAAATSSRFVDVPADAYYADAVDWAVDKGITTGTSDTTFSPNDPCTRGQMVTFLWRLAGQPAPTGSSNPFTDVKEGAYYYDAVLWAVEKGITLGTSATAFSPNDTVNRAQTATFLYRYLQSNGGGFTGAWAFPLNYADAADVPEYAYEAFCYWTMQGVIQGADNNMLRPLDDCLRGQIVTMMYRAFQ